MRNKSKSYVLFAGIIGLVGAGLFTFGYHTWMQNPCLICSDNICKPCVLARANAIIASIYMGIGVICYCFSLYYITQQNKKLKEAIKSELLSH